MNGVGELEKAALERYLFNLIKKLDYGKGVDYTLLLDLVLEEPMNSLLDKGLIYEPVLGVVKVL